MSDTLQVGRLKITIPARRKALVQLGSIERVVEGPLSVMRWNNVRLFDRVVLNSGDEGTIVDEFGKESEVKGPIVVDIHPDGQFLAHQKVAVSRNEAVILIDENGEWKPIKGQDVSGFVIIKPRQRLHTFAWTGGDEFNKVPGFLKFNQLRLQPQQAWFGVQARTKDHCVVQLSLQITWKVESIEKAAQSSNDPIGYVWNLIAAKLCSKIGNLSFEEFLNEPTKLVEKDALSLDGEDGKAIEEQGLKVTQIILRKWTPADRNVDATLAKSAVIQTERELTKANHQLEMDRIQNRNKEMAESKKNKDLEQEIATEQGKAEGMKFDAMMSALKEKFPEAGKEIFALLVAKEADHLSLPPEIIS